MKKNKASNIKGKVIAKFSDGKPKEIKTYPLEGEIVGYNREYGTPATYLLSYKTVKLDYSECRFSVRGKIIDFKTNSELSFKKSFSTLANAEKYFDSMKKKHPISSIVLVEYHEKEIKAYG